MIGYTSLGTNSLQSAAAFYDALLALLDARRIMEFEDFIVWGRNGSASNFSLHVPVDGHPANVGNGTMIALAAANPAQVRTLHAEAIRLGGVDEGSPGPRGDSGFFAAYFRDLDGNKLNVHCMIPLA